MEGYRVKNPYIVRQFVKPENVTPEKYEQWVNLIANTGALILSEAAVVKYIAESFDIAGEV